jgi:hypothetical protein
LARFVTVTNFQPSLMFESMASVYTIMFYSHISHKAGRATTLIIMTFSIVTFSIMTFSIMTLSIMTLSIMTFSTKTLSIMTYSIMTLIIMTFRINGLFVTLSITKLS